MLKSFKLYDGRELLIREQPGDSDLWLVFLPGSSAEIWDFGWAETRAVMGRHYGHANLLVINKPGMKPNGKVDEKAFEASYRRSQRVEDYAEVLRRVIPAGGRIFLVGFSEGAYLSPDVALRDRRIRAMTLISGGTRSWLDEEIYKANSRNLDRVLKKVAQVYARPLSLGGGWHGLSNATWTSYDNDGTVRALERLRIPILAIHGSEDMMIDVPSVREDLERLKRENGKEITLRMFEGVDHTLGRHWLKALRATGAFFGRRLRADDRPLAARRETALVDTAHG